MNLKKLLKDIDFAPGEEVIFGLKQETDHVIELIESELRKQRVDAEIFLGGSLAKNTLVKKDLYDVDIFVRFSWKYENLSEHLEKVINAIAVKHKEFTLTKLHGSRDYFRLTRGNVHFEIIPVLRVEHPKEGRNVTDGSYFHVNYVKKKIKNTTIAKEISLAKAFCRAQGVYGAESYIGGFSGYALECLIIHYKNFEKMLRELSKVKQERLILDPEKKFKKKDEVLFSLNESKLTSPVILIDPTWKERNVLAALTNESFRKFQKAAAAFLKKPNKTFFELREIDADSIEHEAKRRNKEFVKIMIETDKQAGDIAGTKLKKFNDFILNELSQYFKIIIKEFDYNDNQKANIYLVLESKKEIIRIGPPLKMKDAVKAFKKANKKTFEKSGYIHSSIKIDFNAKKFIKDFVKKYSKKLNEMHIIRLEVSD